MSFDIVLQVMAIGSPVVSLAVLFGGLRWHARNAVKKDAEHDAGIAKHADQIGALQVEVASLKAQQEGVIKHMDHRFDEVRSQLSEIFRRLNEKQP